MDFLPFLHLKNHLLYRCAIGFMCVCIPFMSPPQKRAAACMVLRPSSLSPLWSLTMEGCLLGCNNIALRLSWHSAAATDRPWERRNGGSGGTCLSLSERKSWHFARIAIVHTKFFILPLLPPLLSCCFRGLLIQPFRLEFIGFMMLCSGSPFLVWLRHRS